MIPLLFLFHGQCSKFRFTLISLIGRPTHLIAETGDDDLLNDPRRRVDNERQRHGGDGPSHRLFHLDLFYYRPPKENKKFISLCIRINTCLTWKNITLRCSILLCNGHCTHNEWPFWRGFARLLLAAFSLLSELIVGCCCANGRRCRRRKEGSSSSESRASTCWPTWERQFGALAHIRPDRRCCN